MTSFAGADQAGSIKRKGYFKELTDSESDSFDIYNFRMAADGSKVVYFGWTGSYTQLWVINGDGTSDTLVEQAEQHQGLLNGLYDISDDGSKIVYFRYTSIADPTPELVVYDVGTMARTQILKLIPVSNWGTPDLWVVKPQNDGNFLRLTGDGTKVFFINEFGPVHGSPSSWHTIYRVNTDGTGLTSVLESVNIQLISGVGADTYSVTPWEGEIATDYTGSKFAVPLTGSNAETVLVTMNGDGSNPTVIQDVRDGTFYGPAMSGDGTKIVYSRNDTTDLADTGIFVTGPSLPQSPVRVEPNSGYWGVFPEISSDGGSVVYNFDLGGGSSPAIRWANAAGTSRLPVTHPTVVAHSRPGPWWPPGDRRFSFWVRPVVGGVQGADSLRLWHDAFCRHAQRRRRVGQPRHVDRHRRRTAHLLLLDHGIRPAGNVLVALHGRSGLAHLRRLLGIQPHGLPLRRWWWR